KTALGLTLVLHELGTNAVKYGALSGEGGHVDIAWTMGAGGDYADLSWRESGGPRVAAPARQGFGSHLIARSLPPVDGIEATIDYAPTGVVFRARVAVVVAGDGSPPAQ